MADEEKYSEEEEFGFSEDSFESEGQDEEETDLFNAGSEESYGDDPYAQASKASSGNSVLRYALFAVVVVAIGFGGYQLFTMFSPSTPESAVDKSGKSLVSELSKNPSVQEGLAEMKMPESEAAAPAPMATMEQQPESMQAPQQPASMEASEPSSTMEAAADVTTTQPETAVSADLTPAPAAEVASVMNETAVQTPEPSAATQVTQVVSPAAERVVVRHEPSPAMLQRQDSIENSVRMINERLIKLEDMQRSRTDDGKNLKEKIDQVNVMLRKLDEKLTALDTEVDKIHDNVNQHKTLIMKKIKPAKHAMMPVESSNIDQSEPKALYYIQALVPGRAWIKSENGSTITVRKGSRISGYGVVREIDVVNGRMLTTSGRVIRFHPSER